MTEISKGVSTWRWFSTPERRTVILVGIAMVLVFAVAVIVRPGFGSPGSLKTLLMLASFGGYVATGQMLVMLTGGIDLSIPWILNSSAIVYAIIAGGQPELAPVAILVGLAVATGLGLLNGIGVGIFGISAVVMTLGMAGVIEGLTLGLTKGMTCARCSYGTPSSVGSALLSETAGIPNGILMWIGISMIVAVFLSFSRFGRGVYAVGTSPTASFLSGLPTRRITALLYALSGLFAGLAGITLASYGGSPTLGLGNPYLLQSVAIVVIGGVSVLGGRGLFLGVFFAAVILTVLLAFLQAFNIAQYWRDILYGVLLIGILLTYSRERKFA